MSLIKKILLFDPLIQLGCAVWNLCMDLVSALFGITPTNIGGGKIWAFMVGNIYPTFLAIGASLLCIFFLIGFCKEAADIRLVLNAESSLMMFVRLVVSNAAVTTVLAWAPVFFVMATDLTSFGGITDAHFEAFEIEENAGLMTVWTLSFLFCMVAIIGGMMIVFCVYKRAFNLILLLPMAPIALSTLAGGQGISSCLLYTSPSPRDTR